MFPDKLLLAVGAAVEEGEPRRPRRPLPMAFFEGNAPSVDGGGEEGFTAKPTDLPPPVDVTSAPLLAIVCCLLLSSFLIPPFVAVPSEVEGGGGALAVIIDPKRTVPLTPRFPSILWLLLVVVVVVD